MHSRRENHRNDAVWSHGAWLLGLLMVWFGAMRFFPFAADGLQRLLQKYPWLPPSSMAKHLSVTLALVEVGIGLALLVPHRRWRQWAGFAAMLFWSCTLLLLLGSPAWVQEAPYGGFPVIGSGQTLLKHVGIAALALGIFANARNDDRARRYALYGIWAGQLLVLVWIGLMKFTAIEATGVEGLMRSSPLFSWLSRVFDVQGASNVIGLIELATAALIALWPWRPRIARWGLLLAVGTYVLTNSFLLTLPGWQAGHGFPFVGGSGQFLLKDLLLLVGALALLLNDPPSRTAR